MSSEPVVVAEGLGKCYAVYRRPADRLRQFLSPWLRRRLGLRLRDYHRQHWAVRDVSFELAPGEVLGIVGRNGSGKSTLLQLICGILEPSTGSVRTRGRIGALLELGSGFNPEFSGRENVFLNAAVLGLSREETQARFDAIVSFADIGAYIDAPVKTYSSGMALRLAFAVQAQVDPDLLIVDEALAVGDARFQARCFERLRQLRERGTSILLVSHSTEQIVSHCSRALLLEAGSVLEAGAPRHIVNRYLDLLFGESREASQSGQEASLAEVHSEPAVGDAPGSPPLDLVAERFHLRPQYNPHEYRWGDRAATLLDFRLLADGRPAAGLLRPGAELELELALRFERPVARPILGFTIKTSEGVTVAGSNSLRSPCPGLPAFGEPGSVHRLRVRWSNRLAGGDYFASVGIASRGASDILPHDRRYDAIHLEVADTPQCYGLVDLGIRLD